MAGLIRRHRSLIRRLLKYSGVSAISTSVSLTVLMALVATGATTSGWANVIATGVGTVPSFELNRRWVWRRRGQRSMWAEVAPFVALSFVALALSTLAVSSANGWATGAGISRAVRSLVAAGASLVTFGSIWVVQYILLDRVLFRTRRPPSAAPTEPPHQPKTPIPV